MSGKEKSRLLETIQKMPNRRAGGWAEMLSPECRAIVDEAVDLILNKGHIYSDRQIYLGMVTVIEQDFPDESHRIVKRGAFTEWVKQRGESRQKSVTSSDEKQQSRPKSTRARKS